MAFRYRLNALAIVSLLRSMWDLYTRQQGHVLHMIMQRVEFDLSGLEIYVEYLKLMIILSAPIRSTPLDGPRGTGGWIVLVNVG